LEIAESFLIAAQAAFKWESDKERGMAILAKWAAAWQGQGRKLEMTSSNHGVSLHFMQFIGGFWCKAFAFHASRRDGLRLRGPDTDRVRKSHKLRANRLDPAPLDSLFEAWSKHPEARPAGNAVELVLVEAHDDVWEIFLQEALSCLREPN